MSGNHLTFNIEFCEPIKCYKCKCLFSVPQSVKDKWLSSGEFWYCPNGHRQHYIESKEQKLQKRLDSTKRQLEAAMGRACALEGQRDQVVRSYNRVRDRIKNGVCPCCNRSFENLMRHMQTKHPEYGGHQKLKILRDVYGLTQHALADEIGYISSNHVSLYENDKPLAEYAKNALDTWIAEQEE